jgi:hypothetical protein
MRTGLVGGNSRKVAGALMSAAMFVVVTGSRVLGEDPSRLKIKRQPVESRSFASIGYHAPSELLDLQFRTGELYRYSKVPKKVFEGLLNAESKGSYFSREIRGKFHYQHLPSNSQ